MAPSPSPRRLIDVLPAMELPTQFDRDRVVAFCRERGIVRLTAGPAEVIAPLIYDRKAAARKAAKKRHGAA